MAYGLSNGHLTDDVTWPWKVKLLTPIRLERNISKTTWATDFKIGRRLCIGMPSRRTNNFPKSGRGLGHVTPTIFGIRSNISFKLLELETSNLTHGFVCAMPSRRTNKFPWKWAWPRSRDPYNFWQYGRLS